MLMSFNFNRELRLNGIHLTLHGTGKTMYLDDHVTGAEILFPGVGCFLIAVCPGSAVHSFNAADNEAISSVVH